MINNLKIVSRPDYWKLDKSIERRTKTTEIILHCTATPTPHDFLADEIRNMHLMKGWKEMGYHYLIQRDGTICEGRPEMLVGAHCLKHNFKSIGIAYVGGLDEHGVYPMDTRTEAQQGAFVKLLKYLHGKYPQASLHGHCEFANKACPSFDAHEYDFIFKGEKDSHNRNS